MPAQAAAVSRCELEVRAPEREFDPRTYHRRESLVLRALSCLGGRCPLARSGFAILTYHRIAEQVGADPFLLNVPPPLFRRQLTGLLALGYQAWPLRRCLQAIANRQSIPRRTFVVVFDDGFENVYENAFPVLAELQVPATIFLATAYLDSEDPFPFDATETSAGAWRPLRTTQCQAMAASGWLELGCHTHSHAQFRGHPEAFRADLRESLRTLRERFGQADATFSFPFGLADEPMRRVVQEEGLLCALGPEPQVVQPDSDPFRWGRFSATPFDTPRSLAAKIDGWYSLFGATWRLLRRKPRLRC